jgi:hypothetical protein
MGGLFLDIYVEFIARIIIRLFKLLTLSSGIIQRRTISKTTGGALSCLCA